MLHHARPNFSNHAREESFLPEEEILRRGEV